MLTIDYSDHLENSTWQETKDFIISQAESVKEYLEETREVMPRVSNNRERLINALNINIHILKETEITNDIKT